jgi:hypothetical protein
LGGGVTFVENVITYAGIAWDIINGVQAINEIADIARDAQYSYYGEKTGYVYDKTVFNADVYVYPNVGYGTFDGGLLPSGQWAWIESPPSNAYYVSDSTILDATINNYNSAVNWGQGYCMNYLPE